jgi:hypothetical protein
MARPKSVITLDKIVSTNLDVLESQEAELTKMLNFVKKAKKLFKGSPSASAAPGRKRGPKKKRGRPRKNAAAAAPGRKRGPKKKRGRPRKNAGASPATGRKRRGRKPGPKPGGKRRGRKPGPKPGRKASGKKKTSVRTGSHLDSIFTALKNFNGPVKSGDLIQSMYEKAKPSVAFEVFRQRLYPVLTRAYKTGKLSLKEGKVEMPA